MSSIEADLAAIHDSATAIRADLDRVQVGADEIVGKQARDWAEIEQAGIDEPVAPADVQASAQAAAAADRSEADCDADLEI